MPAALALHAGPRLGTLHLLPHRSLPAARRRLGVSAQRSHARQQYADGVRDGPGQTAGDAVRLGAGWAR
jgi:hypothetical protein